MKKNINFLLILSISLFTNLNCFDDNIPELAPRINHYGPPYLDAYKFRIKLDPKNIINLIPNDLLVKLLGQLNIKADQANAKSEFLKLAASKPNAIVLYSIIWDQMGVRDKWPADRNYNLIFHYVLKKWNEKNKAINLGNFNSMTPMGLFKPNGVEVVANTGVPFGDFKPLSVHIHPDAAGLKRMPQGPWRENELLLSPNNATFHLANTRNIATFWTVAISPDKNNVIIIFNTLIDSDDILDQLAISKTKGKLKPTIDLLNQIATNLKVQKKDADAKALEETVQILSKAKKSEDYLDIFKNDALNKQFKDFPINVIEQDAKNNVYQFEVLNQFKDDVCPVDPIFGSTCGKHAFKNAIFTMLAFDNYLRVDLFKKYSDNLLNLLPESQCIFKNINQALDAFRKRNAVQGNEQYLRPEEVQHILVEIKAITEACGLPGITSNLFSVFSYDFLDLLSKYRAGTEQLSDIVVNETRLKEMVDLNKQINDFKANRNYKHSFILGVPGHWINLTVVDGKFIVEDSAYNNNRTNDARVLGFINALKNMQPMDINVINAIKLFSQIKIDNKNLNTQIRELTNNRINNQNINNVPLVQKHKSLNLLIIGLADLVINAIELNKMLKVITGLGKQNQIPDEINKTFNLQEIYKFALEGLKNPIIVNSIPNIDEIVQAFNAVVKSEDTIVFNNLIHGLIQPFLKQDHNAQNKVLFETLIKKAGLADIVNKVGVDALMKDINIALDANKVVLLIYAVNSQNIDLIRLVLDLGGNVMAADKNGSTVLVYAQGTKNPAVIKLIEQEILKKSPAKQKYNKLKEALKEIGVEASLKENLDLNTPIDKPGHTFLMFAANANKPKLVKLLMDSGATGTKAALDFINLHHPKDPKYGQVVKVLSKK